MASRAYRFKGEYREPPKRPRRINVHRCSECPLLIEGVCRDNNKPVEHDPDLYRQGWCRLPLTIGKAD